MADTIRIIQYMLGVLIGDLALLIPFALEDECGEALTTSGMMLLVVLGMWKMFMLVLGVYLAIKCRIIPLAKYVKREV